MSKKLVVFLAVFIASVFTLTVCKKSENSEKSSKDTKKAEAKKENVKKEKKEVAKKVVKKETLNKALPSKLDFSFFPDNSVVVGSFDAKAFMGIKELKPLFSQGLEQSKALGFDLDKATFMSFYLGLDSMNPDDFAIVINNFTIKEETLKKLPEIQTGFPI